MRIEMPVNNCRWLDRYFGTVCRNMKTHPNMVHMDDGTTVFREPTCKRCDGCGYEPITPNTPAWDDGEDEADIRAAADILDSFADVGEIEGSNSRYSPFRDMQSKCLVSPRRIAQAFSRAYVRAAERMVAPCS